MKIEKNITLPNMFNQNPSKRKNTNIAEKMEFGDSVFFKEKKDYLNFSSCLRYYVYSKNKIFPNPYYYMQKINGIEYEYKKYVQYVYGRKVENGYRVWLLDGLKVAIEADKNNHYWRGMKYYLKNKGEKND